MNTLPLFNAVTNNEADRLADLRITAELRRFEQNSRKPRPECGDCPAWQIRAGCGYLGSGTPCKRVRAKNETPN